LPSLVEQGVKLPAVKTGRIRAIEHTQTDSPIKKTIGRQSVADPAKNQRRAQRTIGQAVLLHENLQQPRDSMDSLRTRHGHRIGKFQLGQGLLLSGLPI